MDKINIAEKFDSFTEYWSPRIVAEVNGQHVRAAKLQGEFIWHKHEREDELFLVVKGEMKLHFRDKTVNLGPGEMIVVPRGVEHKPEAAEEAHVLLFEPAATVNTGNIHSERTVAPVTI